MHSECLRLLLQLRLKQEIQSKSLASKEIRLAPETILKAALKEI